MAAYAIQDRIEQSRWDSSHAADIRQQWIDDRAKELIAMFPKEPGRMSSLFLPHEAWFCLLGDKAEEAYNDYITACCYARAEVEWQSVAPCPF